MDTADKRHIRRKYSRVSITLVALSACRSQADGPATDGGLEASVVDASTSVTVDAAVAVPPPRPTSIYGEWERQSEPYRGMRIALREGESTALVTRSSTVDATAKNKAQLACQASLWKPGDVLVTGFDGVKGTIVVRDWGLTQGVCRHQDTKVLATFVRADADVLAIAVSRGKVPVTQEWIRVAERP